MDPSIKTKLDLPDKLPIAVKERFIYEIGKILSSRLPPGQTERKIIESVKSFFDYGEVQNIILDINRISDKCAQFTYICWFYAYGYETNQIIKYKTNDVIEGLKKTREKVLELVKLLNPVQLAYSEKGNAAGAIGCEANILFSKTLKKFAEKSPGLEFAKVLTANKNLFEINENFPNVHTILEFLAEEMRERIDKLESTPFEYEKLLPGKKLSTEAADKGNTLVRYIHNLLKNDFPNYKIRHVRWLEAIVNALVNDEKIKITKDNIRKTINYIKKNS